MSEKTGRAKRRKWFKLQSPLEYKSVQYYNTFFHKWKQIGSKILKYFFIKLQDIVLFYHNIFISQHIAQLLKHILLRSTA